MKRGSIEEARLICYEIAGPTDEDDNEGRGYGSVDVAEILSAGYRELEAERDSLREFVAAYDAHMAADDYDADGIMNTLAGMLAARMALDE